MCPSDVPVTVDRSACAYQHAKGYRYWQRADAHGTLVAGTEPGCPFGGPGWQLWVNHTLAHVEAARRGAPIARLLVCASADNHALLHGGRVLADFARTLRAPDTVGMLDLDALLDRVGTVQGAGDPWARALRDRYARV